jgi:hypothetical protein
MASETPKKLVDTDKCFGCPTILQKKKERVRLFGESKVGGRDVASTLTYAKEARRDFENYSFSANFLLI